MICLKHCNKILRKYPLKPIIKWFKNDWFLKNAIQYIKTYIMDNDNVLHNSTIHTKKDWCLCSCHYSRCFVFFVFTDKYHYSFGLFCALFLLKIIAVYCENKCRWKYSSGEKKMGKWTINKYCSEVFWLKCCKKMNVNVYI